jgi:hypothetical protein
MKTLTDKQEDLIAIASAIRLDEDLWQRSPRYLQVSVLRYDAMKDAMKDLLCAIDEAFPA